LMPRKAEDNSSDGDLEEGERSAWSSDSESENRLKSLKPKCCCSGLLNVSPDPDISAAMPCHTDARFQIKRKRCERAGAERSKLSKPLG